MTSRSRDTCLTQMLAHMKTIIFWDLCQKSLYRCKLIHLYFLPSPVLNCPPSFWNPATFSFRYTHTQTIIQPILENDVTLDDLSYAPSIFLMMPFSAVSSKMTYNLPGLIIQRILRSYLVFQKDYFQ